MERTLLHGLSKKNGKQCAKLYFETKKENNKDARRLYDFYRSKTSNKLKLSTRDVREERYVGDVYGMENKEDRYDYINMDHSDILEKLTIEPGTDRNDGDVSEIEMNNKEDRSDDISMHIVEKLTIEPGPDRNDEDVSEIEMNNKEDRSDDIGMHDIVEKLTIEPGTDRNDGDVSEIEMNNKEENAHGNGDIKINVGHKKKQSNDNLDFEEVLQRIKTNVYKEGWRNIKSGERTKIDEEKQKYTSDGEKRTTRMMARELFNGDGVGEIICKRFGNFVGDVLTNVLTECGKEFFFVEMKAEDSIQHLKGRVQEQPTPVVAVRKKEIWGMYVM